MLLCPDCGHKITLKPTQHKNLLAYECKGCKKVGTHSVSANQSLIRVKSKDQRTADGIVFASATEMQDYLILKARERAGEIKDLTLQYSLPLEVPDLVTHRTTTIGTYTADFVYFQDGKMVVHDSKGYSTREFRRTKKLVKALYGIDIQTKL